MAKKGKKEIEAYIKLQIPAGGANPSPPVGPALGQHGVNIQEFCKSFNGRTEKIEKGMKVPVIISVYSDKSRCTFQDRRHETSTQESQCHPYHMVHQEGS